MIEAVVQKFLGEIFVESGFLVEVVKERNVYSGGWLDTIAKTAHDPHVYLLLRGYLLYYLQEGLLLYVVLSSIQKLYQLIYLI